MAKGLGLIGNFKGKVGNMVGYSLKDSNNKQTQGIRVYQPVVRNPKTRSQAEQRARMAPINRFYRLLKPIIDRGQEGVPYGNKSRLRWLSDAMKGFEGPWLTPDNLGTYPLVTPLTKGSLPSLYINSFNDVKVYSGNLAEGTAVNTIGSVSTILKNANPGIEEGDQVTFVVLDTDVEKKDAPMTCRVHSLVIDSESVAETNAFRLFTFDSMNFLALNTTFVGGVTCAILSREGTSGQHLRSTSVLNFASTAYPDNFYTADAKAEAIAAYMAQGSTTDWPQEGFIDQ